MSRPVGLLGRRPVKPPEERLPLRWAHEYLSAPLPAAEYPINVSEGITDFGMFANTRYGNCVIEGTLVEGSGIRAAYRSAYSGPVVRLTLESGKALTVTPNHAVLTPGGFTLAHRVKKGDYLVSGTFRQVSDARTHLHFDQPPTRIEEVFATLDGVRASFVSDAVDFHGDARFMDGDVQVVSSDRQLRREVNAALSQPETEQQVQTRRHLQTLLHRQGASVQRRFTGSAAALGGVRRGDQGRARLGSEALPLEQGVFAEGPALTPAESEQSLKSSVSNTVLFSQPKRSFSGFVSTEGGFQANQVLGVRHAGSDMRVGASGTDIYARVMQRSQNGAAAHAERGSDGVGTVATLVLSDDCFDIKDHALPCGHASLDHPTGEGRPSDPQLFGELIGAFPRLVSQERVAEVECFAWSGHVFDLSTEPNWYAANGIVVHNCAIAGELHLEMTTAKAAGTVGPNPTDTQLAISRYVRFTGTPTPPGPGCNLADLLLWLYKQGIVLAFAPVTLSNLEQQDAFMAAGFGLYTGVLLTQFAQQDFAEHVEWGTEHAPQPDPSLGHCILRVGASGPADTDESAYVTWGAIQFATRAWDRACVEEAWLVVTREEQLAKFTPQLIADCKALIERSGTVTETTSAAPSTPSTSTVAEVEDDGPDKVDAEPEVEENADGEEEAAEAAGSAGDGVERASVPAEDPTDGVDSHDVEQPAAEASDFVREPRRWDYRIGLASAAPVDEQGRPLGVPFE